MLKKKSRLRLHPVQILPLGFLLLILLGTLLLCLPIASRQRPLPFMDALFTSVSASCVTGLTVIDPGTQLTLFGQIVLLFLIQVGGLGFMTFAGVLFLRIRKRISLQNRLAIAEAQGTENLSDVGRITLLTVRFTFCTELLGAVLLCIRFIPQFGWGDGIWKGIFHSISAFCNAGFDLMGNYESLLHYTNDVLVNIVIMALIILGGLGFAVIADIVQRPKKHNLKPYTKLILVATAVLILGGAGLILVLEWNNPATLGSFTVGEKVLASLFQSVTLRTAGFATLDQGALHIPTKMISILLMAVGAASAGTGGGIKIGTAALLVLFVGSAIRSRADVNLYGRRVPQRQIQRAVAIFALFFTTLILFSILFFILDASSCGSLENLFYELTSALGTVGLSVGITGTANIAGRILLMIAMFMGRIGPLSLVIALSGNDRPSGIRYPETYIMVG